MIDVCPGDDLKTFIRLKKTARAPGGGGGLLPYRGLMGTCVQPGYVFRDFCLKQVIDFIIFCLNQGIDFRVSFLGR